MLQNKRYVCNSFSAYGNVCNQHLSPNEKNPVQLPGAPANTTSRDVEQPCFKGQSLEPSCDVILFSILLWEATDLGKCHKGKSPKVAREVAKGLLDPGSKGLQRVFCTTQSLFAPVRLHFVLAQEAFCSLGPKICCTLSLPLFGIFLFRAISQVRGIPNHAFERGLLGQERITSLDVIRPVRPVQPN